jgi:hypothetical protein
LLDLGENPTCCLAKREIYFQFPRAAAGARNVVWQKYVLPIHYRCLVVAKLFGKFGITFAKQIV